MCHKALFGDWLRYVLFCLWIMDIFLIFVVYHLKKRLNEITEKYKAEHVYDYI